MKIDELIGSLLTFEMDIVDKSKKKGKGVAFKANIIDNEYQVSHGID